MIQRYNLNLVPMGQGVYVRCSQYDKNLRIIEMALYNGNAVFNIPEGSVVTVRGTKPKDNTGFEYECSYLGSTVSFEIQDQMTVYAGKLPAEIRITKDGAILGSANFCFNVEPAPLTDDTVISETQLPLLEQALQASESARESMLNAQGYAQDASDSATAADESEANALSYSQNAQTSANSASQSEANALTYSQNASESASEAQGFAQDSEDSATQAQGYATSASQSATTAQQIADNIADLVDEAQGYASQSSQSASQAQGYATQASQSATNASQSASNAQTYASNANTSAQNASSSATSAQTYAENASTSATQSASSATQSAQSATNAQGYANNASTSATQAQGYASNASDSATASADSATESQGYAQNASDSASEAQELVDNVEERIKNKADKDGVYPKLVAGDLVESEVKDDVFTYQVTDHTGKANINSIKGNTINWNQLINTVVSKTSDGITTSFDSSTGLFSIKNDSRTTNFSSGSNSNVLVAHANCIANHKYLINVDKNITGLTIHTGAEQLDLIPRIMQYQGSGGFYIRITWQYDFVSAHPIGDVTSFHIYIVDLTQMGLDITDPSDFTSLFSLPYYAYNQGTLLSFNGNGIKTVGFNQWDEEWESGRINSDGTKVPSSTYIRSKNYIHIFPNTTYYRKSPNNIQTFYYDGNMNFISYGLWGANSTFVTPNNAEYMLFHIDPTYGTTYKNDICINISNTESNGTYEPYTSSTLSLPISTYFPTGMKSAGSAYDELTSNKAITRIKVLDLGTIDTSGWQYFAGRSNFYTIIPDMAVPINANIKANAKCKIGVPITWNEMLANKNENGTYAITQVGTEKRFYIKNTNYSSVTDFMQYVNGLHLYYELETPTETDVDLDLSYSTYEGGTEQLLPVNTDVPVTSPISMNVEFDFGENLNARFTKVLNMIAPVESAQVSKAYSVGQYLIYDYTLYKVTSNIASGGTITVGTNVTATTLAEILETL